MLNNDKIVGFTHTRSIRYYGCREGCSVISGLVTSFKAEKRKVNVDDAWFRVSPLSLSLSWSSGLQIVVCFPLICSAIEKFVFFIVFLFWSDQIGFFFVFLLQKSRIGWKITFVYIIFWQISSTFHYALILCAETPFFHFEESLSANNIRWMLLWVLVAIIILCTRLIRKRSLLVI